MDVIKGIVNKVASRKLAVTAVADAAVPSLTRRRTKANPPPDSEGAAHREATPTTPTPLDRTT